MTIQIKAPLTGLAIPLDQVPDPVFAQKILGDGIAFEPTGTQLVAPATGTVTYIHPSHHALTLTLENSTQILLHVGIDTVQLKGEGFHLQVALNERVVLGQELISFDADLIARKARSLITVLVITEPAGVKLTPCLSKPVVAAEDVVLEINSSNPIAPLRTNFELETYQEIKTLPLKVHLHSGLHARPSGTLAAFAKTLASELFVVKSANGARANAKSVTALLELEVPANEEIYFVGSGVSAQKDLTALDDYFRQLKEEAQAPQTDAHSTTSPLKGICLSPGLAIGQVVHIRAQKFAIVEDSKTSPEEETERLTSSLERARSELNLLAERSPIFKAHSELLSDPEILKSCTSLLESGKTAEFAWHTCLSLNAERLSRSQNTMLSERAADLRDVRDRVLGKLVNQVAETKEPSYEHMILVGQHLTPSDTVAYSRERVVGFGTTSGGVTSHVAILAGSMGIPAVGGLDLAALKLEDGCEVVIDGLQGILRRPVDEAERLHIKEVQSARLKERELAILSGAHPAITKDGHSVSVHANISSVEEARSAQSMGADGIGLLRSEFLFLERTSAPSEEEQLKVYQEVADIFKGKPLVIRTLDVGGDKPLPYLDLPIEENPFLGVRGVRVSLRHEAMFRAQIRAILRVKASGPIHLMFPMVATLEEFRAAKNIVEDERHKLSRAPLSVGIMMEIPSVALIAEAFAKEVDFFSIGTNDLTQYTLAMDRGNSDLAHQTDGLHPSILRMIELTVKAARDKGKWVGVCGGLASDPKAVAILVGLGVHELSAGLMAVSQVKAQIRSLAYSDCETIASSALQASTAKEVRNLRINPNQTVGIDL